MTQAAFAGAGQVVQTGYQRNRVGDNLDITDAVTVGAGRLVKLRRLVSAQLHGFAETSHLKLTIVEIKGKNRYIPTLSFLLS